MFPLCPWSPDTTLILTKSLLFVEKTFKKLSWLKYQGVEDKDLIRIEMEINIVVGGRCRKRMMEESPGSAFWELQVALPNLSPSPPPGGKKNPEQRSQ